MRKIVLAMLLVFCLVLVGCGTTEIPAPAQTLQPTPEIKTEAPAQDFRQGLEKVRFLSAGQEVDAFLAVEEKGVAFYADEEEKRIVAFCAFPSMEGERGAYVQTDLMDYNEDGMTDPTVIFENACLMWLSDNGTLVFNPEFSTLPEDAGAKGEK